MITYACFLHKAIPENQKYANHVDQDQTPPYGNPVRIFMIFFQPYEHIPVKEIINNALLISSLTHIRISGMCKPCKPGSDFPERISCPYLRCLHHYQHLEIIKNITYCLAYFFYNTYQNIRSVQNM